MLLLKRRRPVRKPGVFDSYAILYEGRIIKSELHTQEGAWQHYENKDESRSRERVGGILSLDR
jgi:hypothetical protein